MNKKELDHQYYHVKGYKEELKLRRKKNLKFYRDREKQWRLKNPERNKGKSLQKYWKGSTWKEALQYFNELKAKQNNLCAICKSLETCPYNKNPNIIRDLCVDHCHKTGKVRGLLCDNCNVMLGRAKDNEITCLSAAKYLIENK